MPQGSPYGAQCTVKDKQGIPGDSQEKVEVSEEGGCGVFQIQRPDEAHLSSNWNRKSPAVHQKPEQGLKRHKKEKAKGLFEDGRLDLFWRLISAARRRDHRLKEQSRGGGLTEEGERMC